MATIDLMPPFIEQDLADGPHADLEPDRAWKAALQKQVEDELRHSTEKALQERDALFSMQVEHAEHTRLMQDHIEIMVGLRCLAREMFKLALDRERQERKWALESSTLLTQHQSILAAIQRQTLRRQQATVGARSNGAFAEPSRMERATSNRYQQPSRAGWHAETVPKSGGDNTWSKFTVEPDAWPSANQDRSARAQAPAPTQQQQPQRAAAGGFWRPSPPGGDQQLPPRTPVPTAGQPQTAPEIWRPGGSSGTSQGLPRAPDDRTRTPWGRPPAVPPQRPPTAAGGAGTAASKMWAPSAGAPPAPARTASHIPNGSAFGAGMPGGLEFALAPNGDEDEDYGGVPPGEGFNPVSRWLQALQDPAAGNRPGAQQQQQQQQQSFAVDAGAAWGMFGGGMPRTEREGGRSNSVDSGYVDEDELARREEETRRQEAEIWQRLQLEAEEGRKADEEADEARRREEEARKSEEAEQRKEQETKRKGPAGKKNQKEARRREQETRQKEEETRRKEQEAKINEEEARKREEDKRVRNGHKPAQAQAGGMLNGQTSRGPACREVEPVRSPEEEEALRREREAARQLEFERREREIAKRLEQKKRGMR